MANTFLRKISRNIGASLTAVGGYTVGANVGAVIVGLNISNTSAAQITANIVINNGTDDFYLTHRIPVAAGGAVSIAGGEQKIILQTGDAIKVNSSAASSLDVLMNIMETDGVGVTDDYPGGGFATPFTYSKISGNTDFTNANGIGSPGLWISGNGATVSLLAKASEWTDSAKFNNLIAMPPGTSGTILPAGWSFMSYTTTSAWTLSGGIYSATASGDVVTYFLSGDSAADRISVP